MTTLRIKFQFEHGSADGHVLDAYDAARALTGIARSLNITLHALLNDEVRTQGDTASGVEVFLAPPRRGSFVYELVMSFSELVATGVAYDFIKYAFNEAIGNDADEAHTAALQKRIEPTMGALPAALETALLEAHRPIAQAPEMTLTVMRPRGQVLARFDNQTIRQLQPTFEDLDAPVLGHVTRYNTISEWGKLYSHDERRVVSFQIVDELDMAQRSLITWSLHQNNLGQEGAIALHARALMSPGSHRVKRYLVTHVARTA